MGIFLETRDQIDQRRDLMCGASLLPGQARGTVNGAEILQQTTLGADLRLEMTKYDIKIQSMKLILLTTHTNPISYNIEIFLSDKNTKVKIEIKKKSFYRR